jgi:hypothetical protein
MPEVRHPVAVERHAQAVGACLSMRGWGEVSGPEGTPNGVDRLAHLRQVAQAADNGSPWEWEHAYPQRVTRIGDVVLVAECFENPDMPSRFAEFIATFDPPVALALVEIAKAARAVNEHAKRDLPEWYADDGDYTVEDFDYFIQLDRALARLDSGAAEEDA